MAENPDIDFLVSKTSKLNIGYYGLQGLDPDAILYRACNKDADISKDILCKDPNSDRTVEQHIASGSKKPSRYISTTTSSKVILKWAEEGQPLMKIYVSRLDGMETLDKMINLTDKDVREHFIKGAIHKNWAKSSKEVLFQYCIPKKNSRNEDVFVKWEKPTDS